MSLAEKWEEFSLEFLTSGRARTLESMREAFYAGAEAAIMLTGITPDSAADEIKIQAEIDHFRSHK